MFARTAERKMRIVRGLLLIGWLGLILSLFYDPITAHWTEPDNIQSPFHIGQSSYQLRDEAIPVQPYPMGNRIFWTMILPIVPIFLLVFGHEAWRRICPLSFASQLPRYFGLQRHRLVLERRTGAVKSARNLIRPGSWLERNSWYVQFALLYAGLSARLLIINSDRHALAIAMLGIISAAMLAGYLWDGKTWCNYFCPVNVVQRIYTEPRGLLESVPHLQRSTTPQSSCRTPGTKESGDKNACVSCTVHCGDIDLERQYWDTIDSVPRRNVYYMFPGLVLSFYFYYRVYSGNWDYYMSGIWTHEAGSAGRLMSSGMVFGNIAVQIPKLVAAPLFLGLCVFLSLLIGRSLERCYRKFRVRRGRVSEADIQNHCLSLAAYFSFNCFYLFAGRPNLLLLPSYLQHAADILIIITSTLWLVQALSRTQLKYRRESIAMGLLVQLRNMKIDIGRYFEGRSLDELKPDELYVVSKVLPAFSHEDKLTAYRNLLEDAISTGKASSARFLEALAEMREQLQINDEEHSRVVEQLGVAADVNFDVEAATLQEKAQCIQKYSELIGASIIAQQIALGRSCYEAANSAELAPVIRVLRASMQIADADHESVLAKLVGRSGAVAQEYEKRLRDLKDICATRFCLQAGAFEDGFWSELQALLVNQIESRIALLLREMAVLLASLCDETQAMSYAASMVALDKAACSALLNQPVSVEIPIAWRERLSPALVEILAGRVVEVPETSDPPAVLSYRYRDVVGGGHDLDRCLSGLAGATDPILAALALTAFAYLRRGVAQSFAMELFTREGGVEHWLLREVVEFLTGASSLAEEAAFGKLRITVQDANGERDIDFTGDALSLGSALGNSIVLNGPGVAPYHLALHNGLGGIRLIRLDDAPVRVDGIEMEGASIELDGTAKLTFGEAEDQSPIVRVQPAGGEVPYSLLRSDAVTRLVWLARARLFDGTDLAALAHLARMSEMRRYPRQVALFEAADTADEALILRNGTVRVLAEEAPADAPKETGGGSSAGCVVEWPRNPGVPRGRTVQVTSEFAVILAVKGGSAESGGGALPRGGTTDPKSVFRPEGVMEAVR